MSSTPASRLSLRQVGVSSVYTRSCLGWLTSIDIRFLIIRIRYWVFYNNYITFHLFIVGILLCYVKMWARGLTCAVDQYGLSRRTGRSHFFLFNHFSTIGRYCGTAHYILSIRQAAIMAIVTSILKIFLTQTFPRCGATCYILPSRAMSQLFNGVNFVYRSVEVY